MQGSLRRLIGIDSAKAGTTIPASLPLLDEGMVVRNTTDAVMRAGLNRALACFGFVDEEPILYCIAP